MALDTAILGAFTLNDEGAPQIQVVKPVGDETNDVEPYGECDSMQALGVTAVPWPRDDKGKCEAVVATGCGGRDAIIIGARDNRCAGIYGKLDSGDTCVHTTGPDEVAQLLLKQKKRAAALTCKDSSGGTMLVSLDGKNNEFQILAFGMGFKFTKGEGVTITNGEGAQILMQGDRIYLIGKVMTGGVAGNPAVKIATGTPAAMAAVGLAPAMGLDVGM
jgi:hypothetical protein